MTLGRNIAMLTAFSLTLAGSGLAQTKHFRPKGKPPSEHTLEVLRQARARLPFSDTRDFEEEKKGFIAAPKSKKRDFWLTIRTCRSPSTAVTWRWS